MESSLAVGPHLSVCWFSGVATFDVFALVEWKTTAPLLPLRFFGRRSSLAILGINMSQSFITTARTYFLPFYFQLGLGVSSLASGIYFLPTTLTYAVFFLCVGHIVRRTGECVMLSRYGACALILGTGLLIDSQPYISRPRIIIFQIIIAIGLGLTYLSSSFDSNFTHKSTIRMSRQERRLFQSIKNNWPELSA